MLYLNENCVPEAKPVLREKITSDSCPALLAEIPKATYGPVLPPPLSDNSDEISKSSSFVLVKSQDKSEIDRDTEFPENRSFIGPCLPSSDILNASNHLIGCVNVLELDTVKEKSMDCDRYLYNSKLSESEVDSASENLSFGPALPPHLLQQKHSNNMQSKVIGPVLPTIVKSCTEDKHPPHSSESEDDAIGPLPVDHPALRSSDVHKKLEHRAQRIKTQHKEEDKDILNKREEWMIELPPAQANNFGLGPRKFRSKEGPDMSDRSCWTDTPAKIAKKQRKAEEAKMMNLEVSHKVSMKEHSKSESGKSRKREKSLLEIHQSKLQKKKKKEERDANLMGQSTRRPFDRDIDLKANQLDRAQKKTILMKAQLLDDRFSRGEI
ncbi:hypothetical protein KM043_014098 [Ampulex compressa]|nr:hypothetical protein KM043_014098 [Ampulex compressa]